MSGPLIAVHLARLHGSDTSCSQADSLGSSTLPLHRLSFFLFLDVPLHSILQCRAASVSLSFHPTSSPSKTGRAAGRGSDSLCVHHPNLHPFPFILNSRGKIIYDSHSTSGPDYLICAWKFSDLSVCALQQL